MANLLAGAPFHTFQFSGKGQVKYAGWTGFVAGSATGNELGIFNWHEPPTPTCSNTRSIAPAKKLLVLALPMTSAIPSAT